MRFIPQLFLSRVYQKCIIKFIIVWIEFIQTEKIHLFKLMEFYFQNFKFLKNHLRLFLISCLVKILY